MTIDTEEGVLTERAVPGPALYYNAVSPSAGQKAIVAILHGYADYGARYLHVMGALAEHGIASVALDMRGHGRASGPRGYCASFDEFLDDAGELAQLVSDRAKGTPQFLLGHSFGGLVATSSILADARAYRGVILSAPFFGLALEVPALKRVAARIAARVLPRFALPTGLTGAHVTHDLARARAYDEDPLVFKKATARWFVEAQRAQVGVRERASLFTLPLYMLVGTADSVASVDASRRFFDAVASKDKLWDAREGLYHEALNEPSWKEITDALATWVLERAA